MRKTIHVKIGDYVLASKYADKSPMDPWFIGLIRECGTDLKGLFFKVEDSVTYWRHVWRITSEEGARLLKERQGYERNRMDSTNLPGA